MFIPCVLNVEAFQKGRLSSSNPLPLFSPLDTPTCSRPLDPPLSETEGFDLLKVCVGSAFALPPVTHTPERIKDEEALDPQQREVRVGGGSMLYLHAL